jgi:LacI family transcriptional regulator
MATIKDVARRAGVSIGSVSAVVNERAVTSPELRERVLAAILELGYTPHAGARSLKVGRTRSMGLLVPDIINPHFAALASAIERSSERSGYTLSFGNTLGDLDKEARHLELFRRQRVDGLILDPAGTSPDYINRMRRTINVPTVLIDRRVDGLPFDSVLVNNYAAGSMVTEYLVRSGHRRIAILIGQLDFSTAVERLQGYLDVLEKNNIPRDDRLILQGLFDIEPACKATVDMLSSGLRPTAIFCINNQMTIGAMQALAEQGFRCPQDISVAGVDDLPTAAAFSPRLTVAVQPTVEIGEKAVACLLARLNGTASPDPVHIVCEPRLVVRSSCRVIDAAAATAPAPNKQMDL